MKSLSIRIIYYSGPDVQDIPYRSESGMTSKTAMFADKTLLGRVRELLINSEKRVLTSAYTVFEENIESF